jgi:N-acyl amino acid synthase of PEP-CTERM/exosortase system
MSSTLREKKDDDSGRSKSLLDHFTEYFSVEYASTPAQKHEIYHIRFRVYCEEFKYEPIPETLQNRELGEEHDEFDDNSLHCLIRHRSSGMAAGCVRLVTADDRAQGGRLPLEKYCEESLDRAFIDSLQLARASICEISRLAVDGAFRRRSGEALTRFGEVEAMDCSQQEKRTFSLIAVAGFLAATALTDLQGTTNVFAMMEPFLPRLMKRSGIEFRPAGRDMNYHGIRAPYFITTQSALDGMLPDLKDLYGEIRQQIEKDFITAK